MKPIFQRLIASTAITIACIMLCLEHAHADEAAATLPSDTPKTFKPRTDTFDYVKREEMLAMRDGVKLKTFILVPKGVARAPMLLTRTHYNASERALRVKRPH